MNHEESKTLKWVEPGKKKKGEKKYVPWNARLKADKKGKRNHNAKLIKKIQGTKISLLVSTTGAVNEYPDLDYTARKGANIKLNVGTASPAYFTFEEWADLNKAVEDAKDYLSLLSV